MAFLKSIKLFFSLPPSPPSGKSISERRNSAVKKIVSMKSSGNVLLQKGRYATAQDVIHRKQSLLNYKFSA